MKNFDRKAYLAKIDETIATGKYQDNWESMMDIPVPEWYRDAKFGIFIHWGVYSVPAFANEWYPRNMYKKDTNEFKHHMETYGAHKDFGYKDFVPMFKAEKFDSSEWAKLFSDAGAKYVMPVAEHHDGFQMYKSDISEWNAYEKGPHRDIVGELKVAVEENDMRLCVSSHRIEHWFFMGGGKEFDSDIKETLTPEDLYWPAMGDVDHMTLDNYISDEYMQDWLIRCCELVDRFRPAIFYFDWWIQMKILKPYLKKFAAYYYNKLAEWGMQGVINYKFDAFAFGTAVLDLERGQFSSIQANYWQTDTAIARNSWCYTENNQFKPPYEVICDLADIVSKNGTLLLNVGPKSDGTISDEDKAVLLGVGRWLAVNGEAIYGTRPFKVYGEGPTQIKDGHFTDGEAKVFTSSDIRFTRKGTDLYAIVLACPENGEVNIKSLAWNSHSFHGVIKDITLLGSAEKVEYSRDFEGVKIKTNVKSDMPVVFKFEID